MVTLIRSTNSVFNLVLGFKGPSLRLAFHSRCIRSTSPSLFVWVVRQMVYLVILIPPSNFINLHFCSPTNLDWKVPPYYLVPSLLKLEILVLVVRFSCWANGLPSHLDTIYKLGSHFVNPRFCSPTNLVVFVSKINLDLKVPPYDSVSTLFLN